VAPGRRDGVPKDAVPKDAVPKGVDRMVRRATGRDVVQAVRRRVKVKGEVPKAVDQTVHHGMARDALRKGVAREALGLGALRGCRRTWPGSTRTKMAS